MEILKKIYNKLFSTTAAGLYIVLFAVAIGAATFIENDFGTSSAQKVVFKARWFELLLVLFAISLVVNIIRFRMVQQRKWPVLTFHAAMIIIILGAGVTRYFGSEGMMHIREESAANSFLSADTYLIFEAIQQGKKYRFDEPVLFATLGNNHFKKSYLIGGEKVEVEVLDFMPNPAEVMVNDSKGIPVIKVVVGGMEGREEYFVKYKDEASINGQVLILETPKYPALLISNTKTTTCFSKQTYISLPFSIQLHDFIMERYPGTNSASSYASEVTLIDPGKNLKRDQRIYMNNILNYGGYRFFQSSYDQDELGTYLSVNHDAPGTWISYVGYFCSRWVCYSPC
ncbi:MAG: cytochrome c biogenesis protein ResB [Saprospiraceae bacterium]|nr:cytochrome c biogenesis protein ResB [Saprospiraceae bacterium]